MGGHDVTSEEFPILVSETYKDGWCDDDPKIWIECEACACWTHASCADYESNGDLEDETFICRM